MCKSPSPSPKLCSSSSLPHTLKVFAAQCSNRSRKWCFSHGERLGEEVLGVWNWGPGHLFANPLYQSAYTVKLRFQQPAFQRRHWMNFGLKVETTLSEDPKKSSTLFYYSHERIKETLIRLFMFCFIAKIEWMASLCVTHILHSLV